MRGILIVMSMMVALCLSFSSGCEASRTRSGPSTPAQGGGEGRVGDLPLQEVSGRLVIVTINGVSLDELLTPQPTTPNIRRLMGIGAVGVMNARTAAGPTSNDDSIGRYSMEGAAATLSAGTRAAASTEARKAFNAWAILEGRPVREVYRALNDLDPGRAEVLHIGVNTLNTINQQAKYPIIIGQLGSVLRMRGHRTAVVGNSDQGATLHREAAIIAADENGIIDFGDVSTRLLENDQAWPYGRRTDAAKLVSAFRRVARKADFIVVDVGDTARAASYAELCTDAQGARMRRQALASADGIIGAALESLDLSRDRVFVVSPSPSPLSVANNDCLPPVIAAGRGISRGLLYSYSTRTPGILTNADISASVLDFFGLALPNSFVGRPVIVAQGDIENLAATNRNAMLATERQPVMRGLAAFMLCVVLLVTGAVVWRRGRAVWASWMSLLPVASILAVLWLPAFLNAGLIATTAALAGLTAGILAAGQLFARSPWRVFAWMCCAIVVTVIADVLRGGHLLRNSVMSYTPVEGARYYGIGNEHMGSTIGAAMIAGGILASVLSGRRTARAAALVVFMLALVAAIGMPSLGANAGGAMSAAAAVAVGLVLWRERKLDRRHIVLAVIAVPAALGVMLLIDNLWSGGSQSHVARAAQVIASGGIGEMAAIIGRKAAMNLMLLQYSPWSRLLIASTAAAILMTALRGLGVAARLRENRDIRSGVIAAAVGALAAFLFNDSGVVAGATAVIYVWTAVLLATREGVRS